MRVEQLVGLLVASKVGLLVASLVGKWDEKSVAWMAARREMKRAEQ